MNSSNWGFEPHELELPFGCDEVIPSGPDSLYRAVSVGAPPAQVFRWLCQLKVAPYSYDWIDNLGRTSPRELTPGCERLEVGQRILLIFRIHSFREDDHITMVHRTPWWGGCEVAVTYRVVAEGEGGTRLLVKCNLHYRAHLLGRLMRVFMPAGDLVMMRKQLLTLKHLAETQVVHRYLAGGLHYVEGGRPDGPLVVMIHGGSGNWSNFRRQLSTLGRRYRIVVPDLRGHGRSPWSGPCQLEDLVDDLRAFVREVNPRQEPFRLVGHSLGGYLAVRLAAACPEVSHLALINTAHTLPSTPTLRRLRRWVGVADWLVRPEGLVTARSEVCAHLIDHLVKQWDCRPYYPAISCPVLVVLGAHDPLVPLEHGRESARLLRSHQPRVQVQELRWGAHLALAEFPGRLNRWLEEHFSAS